MLSAILYSWFIAAVSSYWGWESFSILSLIFLIWSIKMMFKPEFIKAPGTFSWSLLISECFAFSNFRTAFFNYWSRSFSSFAFSSFIFPNKCFLPPCASSISMSCYDKLLNVFCSFSSGFSSITSMVQFCYLSFFIDSWFSPFFLFYFSDFKDYFLLSLDLWFCWWALDINISLIFREF